MTKGKFDAYERITERMLTLLESGTAPWRKPWSGGRAPEMPRSLKSGKSYRGINRVLLACAGYERPEWVTFKQAKERGGCVRKGEKGWPCVFWKFLEREAERADGTKETKRFPMLRLYTVFNVEQVDGIKLPEAEPVETHEFAPIERAAAIWEGYSSRPSLAHSGGRAFYRPSMDAITMPDPERFTRPEEYYSTLFHEATHSTGHVDRLKRDGIAEMHAFGDPVYSREELVAEMGSAFLCQEAGISTAVIENQAAYVGSWIKVLRGDPKLVVIAAAQAQKAADLILGTKFED